MRTDAPSFTKNISLVLLLGALVPYMMVLVFWHERSSIREQMKEQLEMEKAVSVYIPHGEYMWVKPGKEITFNGQLFDVKSMQHSADGMVFTGLYDHEEKAMLANWLDIYEKQTDAGQFRDVIGLFYFLGNAIPHQSAFSVDYAFANKRQWPAMQMLHCTDGYLSIPEMPPPA